MWQKWKNSLSPVRRAVLSLALLAGGIAMGRVQSKFVPYLGDVLCIAGIYGLYQAVRAWRQ